MNGANTDWAQVLVNWLPYIAVIAIWLIYFAKMGSNQKAAVEQSRRIADALERMAALLEKRS
jgi:hypothetical protein